MTSIQEIERIAREKFPKSNPNPGQMEAIVDAVNAIVNLQKKHVIISAPTGSGKSVIATTVHRTIKAIDRTWRSTIITSTKGLQDQYTSDDGEIYDLRSKTNYHCPYKAGPYGSSDCKKLVASTKCQSTKMCPYLKRRMHWCNQAQIRITNSSFHVEAPPALVMMPENKADLLVVDECHEIDDIIIEHSQIGFDLESYGIISYYDHVKFLTALSRYVALFEKIGVGSTFIPSQEHVDASKKIIELGEEIITALGQILEDHEHPDYDRASSAEDMISGIIASASFLSDGIGTTWILMEKGIGKAILKPVFAWQVANRALFMKAKFFLHMSATICGYDQYVKNLGLKEDEVYIIEVGNSIPIKNRKVHVFPLMKVSGNFDVDQLAKYMDSIVKANAGRNGVVHTVSFKLALDLKEKSVYNKDILVSGKRDEILEWLSVPNAGRIVLSPSLVKGYDLRDDISRFQILVKCPFLFLGDPLIALNAKERPDWYARKTILALVQSCGRSVRGPNDWAKTYIIDTNFLRLLRDHEEIFPEWFVESLEIHS